MPQAGRLGRNKCCVEPAKVRGTWFGVNQLRAAVARVGAARGTEPFSKLLFMVETPK